MFLEADQSGRGNMITVCQILYVYTIRNRKAA